MYRQFLLFGIVASSLLTPASGQWAPVPGLPAGFNPNDVALAPDGTVFTSGPATDPAQSGFYRSTNGGTSWSRRSAGLTYNAADLTPWRIGAFSEVTLAATNGGDGIYRSANAGDSWTTAGLGPAAAYWDSCRYNADTYYVTKRENVVGQSGVWRSLDRGATWTRKSTGLYGLTIPVVGEVITAESVHLHNGKLYCGVSTTGVFRSTNGGETWTNLSGNVFVENTVIGPLTACWDLASTGPRLFASIQNTNQVFMTEDDGDTWRQATTGLGLFAQRMAADGGVLYAPQTNGRLYFTTDGRSWQYYPETGLPGGVQPFIAVKHGVAAYYTTASGLYKLDLSTAAPVNIAPVVTLQPVGGTRLVGQSFTFTVNANGTGPFTYQWLKNGAEIADATSASYTRGPLALGDADNYSCRITGPAGTVTSNAVALAVFAETPGTLDPLFDTGVPIANTTNAVNSVIIPASGRLWTAGSYGARLVDATNSQTPAKQLNTYSGSPLRHSTSGEITGGAVNVLLPLANGQVLAGGAFTAAGSPATNTKYLARFNADGTLDSSFAAPATTGAGAVTAMVQDPATQKIYVTGSFVDWGGDPARDSIVRLNADGTVDGTFSSGAIGSLQGTSYSITSLALAPDGKLYVGGSFFGVNIGGSANYNYQYLVRLNTDGAVDTAFPTTSTLMPAQVVALATLPDGRLYVASNNGNNPQQLRRLLPSATVDPSFALTGNATNIATIAVQPDGKFLVGGNFTTFAGTATPGKLVRLLNNGAVDTSVTYLQPGTDTNRNVTSLALSGNLLYVGQFRGGPKGVHRYFNDIVEPSFYAPPQSQNINAGQPATLRAYVHATQPVTYQWYKDGVLIPGATTDTLNFAPLTTGDTGSYTVVVTHPFGPITSPPAVLRALAAPQLGATPSAVTQLGNKPLTLAPDVFGQAPLTYQWLRNGTALTENGVTGGGGNFTGVATRTLNITGLSEADDGVYTLRVTNSLGTLDIPISVTAQYQAGYLPLDFVGPGGLFSFARDAGNDRFFIVGTGGLTTWNGAAVSSQLLRIHSDNTVDTTFNAPVFTTATPPPNNVTWAADTQVLANGQSLVWGSFANVAGVSRPGMARLNSNGSLDPSFLANNGTVANGGFSNISRVLELRDGKLLVAGAFTNWGAGPSFAGYARLVCLDPNGSLNTDFMNALGAAPSAEINDMDLLPDGRVVLCGGFTTIGGLTRNNMAVLEINGAVSTVFVPPSFTNGSPSDIMALPDGRVLAGGTFTSAGGSSAAGWVVLTTNGTRDATVNTSGTPTIPYPVFGGDANGGILVVGVQGSGLRRFTGNFVPDPAWLPVEGSISGFNGINHIIGLPSGRIVVRKGGNSYQGRPVTSAAILRGYPVPLGFIVQPQSQSVDLGGSVTLSVTPTGTSPVTLQWLKDGVAIPGETSAALTISGAARSDSAVYSVRATNFTGGTVTSSGARLIVLAEPVFTSISSSRTVRVGDSVSFSATAAGVAPLQYQWLKNGTNIPGATSATLTLSAVALSDAATYTCAASNIVNNVAGYTLSPPVHLSVAGGNAGALDVGFTLATLTGTASPRVECLLMEPSGQLTIGGNISLANSYFFAARYRPDGTRAGAFQTNSGTGASITSCNGHIYSVARDPQTGNYVAVGTFTLLGGANRARIGRFTPDCLADPTFNPGTGFTETTAFTTANGAALAIDASSRIYVGGNFTAFNGTPVSRVVRLLANGTLDTTFTAPSFNGQVRTLLLQGDKLIVGGSFSQVGGVAASAKVRLNSDGTRDTGFASVVPGSAEVYDLAAGPDGDFFAAASGLISGNQYVHRFNADGSRETSFNTGSTISDRVRALVPLADGRVFIGGSFGQVNGPPRGAVARLNADGTLDTTWTTPGSGLNGVVYDLAYGPNGTLYIGGNFTMYGSDSRQFIAAVYGNAAPRQVVSLPAPPAAVLGQPLTLGVAATGVAFPSAPFLTYQWLKDGVELSGQTGQTLTIASYSAADEGTYTVRVTDAGGSNVSNPVDVAAASGGFTAWANVLPAGQRGPADDPDFDGIPNLVEYALDLNPAANSAGQIPPPVNNGTHLTYTYRRVRSDIAYSVEAGDNLALPWSTANVDQGTPAGDGTTTARLPLTAPEQFLRLRVALVR